VVGIDESNKMTQKLQKKIRVAAACPADVPLTELIYARCVAVQCVGALLSFPFPSCHVMSDHAVRRHAQQLGIKKHGNAQYYSYASHHTYFPLSPNPWYCGVVVWCLWVVFLVLVLVLVNQSNNKHPWHYMSCNVM